MTEMSQWKKNGISQRLWIGHGRTRSAYHASGRQPIRSIGNVSRKRSSKTWFIVRVMIMSFEIQITHLCGESLFVRGGWGCSGHKSFKRVKSSAVDIK